MRIFTSDECLHHLAPAGFPERPERLQAILGQLERSGRPVERAAAAEGWRTAVERVHDAAYVTRFERAVERGDGLLDSADNPLSPGTFDAARSAVAAALAGADWVAGGAGRHGFVAVRPPGHHAERALAMGFCYFNTAAVACEHLRSAHGVGRVAIFDFDVHHGNGTQHIFERSAEVLYASVHQYPFYPGTGAADERGIGPGVGATLNVPLAAGSDDQVYAEAIEEAVLPALERFAPEVLLLSAGFDAWQNDPLGGMRVTAAGFQQWSKWLAALADKVSEGRVLSLLEGGYDIPALPDLVEAHLKGLESG
jgi:acetoin utilization deacetylase AcuC-like enzyme